MGFGVGVGGLVERSEIRERAQPLKGTKSRMGVTGSLTELVEKGCV